MLALGICTVLALNPFFGHAFSIEETLVEHLPYYRVIPYMGLNFHRMPDYSILGGVILLFAVMSYRMPRVYKERYAVILVTMAGAGLWQGIYIFMRIPVNRSMIGLAVFGLLVFYFALYYYPFKFVDRMLKEMAADISSAMFVFDPNEECVWMNKVGHRLLGISEDENDNVRSELKKMFGDLAADKFVSA